MSEMKDKDLGQLGEVITGADYMLGFASGIEKAAQELLEEAGKAYVARDDKRAEWLRILSDQLMEKYRRERAEYNDKERARREAAFAELERRQKFIDAYLAWAESGELCGGPLFDAMVEASSDLFHTQDA